MNPKNNKQNTHSILGLSLDGSRLEGVVLRRSGGAVELVTQFSATLALDALTASPELVGREIRNHLEKAEIRERRCAVCIPLDWVLSLQVRLPDLPEADIAGFLALESERGFPYAPEALITATSRFALPEGGNFATQLAVPRDHLQRLEAVLRSARLVPVTLTPGLPALVRALPPSPEGTIALSVEEDMIGVQVTVNGGVAMLRTITNAIERDGSERKIYADIVARELRITLGHLAEEVRRGIRAVEVFGSGELADRLMTDIAPRLEAMKLPVRRVDKPTQLQTGFSLPTAAPISAAFCLAVGLLKGNPPELNFLPPRVSAWQQFAARYSSKKLLYAGIVACILFLGVASAFGYQQVQLSGLKADWAKLGPKVRSVEGLQKQIRDYRPWFDESFRSLSILRRLTEAFPEDGTVTAKTVEIRETGTVSCAGTARDSQSLNRMLDRLRGASDISDVQVDQVRGKSPVLFTFNCKWRKQN